MSALPRCERCGDPAPVLAEMLRLPPPKLWSTTTPDGRRWKRVCSRCVVRLRAYWSALERLAGGRERLMHALDTIAREEARS